MSSQTSQRISTGFQSLSVSVLVGMVLMAIQPSATAMVSGQGCDLGQMTVAQSNLSRPKTADDYFNQGMIKLEDGDVEQAHSPFAYSKQ